MNNKLSVLHTGTFTQQVSQLQHNQTNENKTGTTLNTSDERNSKHYNSFSTRRQIKRQREERTEDKKRAGICKIIALLLTIKNIKRLKSV